MPALERPAGRALVDGVLIDRLLIDRVLPGLAALVGVVMLALLLLALVSRTALLRAFRGRRRERS